MAIYTIFCFTIFQVQIPTCEMTVSTLLLPGVSLSMWVPLLTYSHTENRKNAKHEWHFIEKLQWLCLDFLSVFMLFWWDLASRSICRRVNDPIVSAAIWSRSAKTFNFVALTGMAEFLLLECVLKKMNPVTILCLRQTSHASSWMEWKIDYICVTIQLWPGRVWQIGATEQYKTEQP